VKVLVTGAGGQLGREIRLECPPGVDLVAVDESQLDLTRASDVAQQVAALQPDVVVNAAAYTAVDRAEQEKDLAFAVNDQGVRNLASAADRSEARLIHFSTDFVFSGDQSRPYGPEAGTDPQGVYGASKLAGEQHVIDTAIGGVVIRTAWVYSRFGHNFVKTMLGLFGNRDEVKVVADQIGTPTWARGLARVVWSACQRSDLQGLYHWTDAGAASWYDFAIAIQEEADGLGLLDSTCRIRPISTADFPTAARRPSYSVLDTTRTCRDLGIEPIHWRQQLRAMLQEIRDHGDD